MFKRIACFVACLLLLPSVVFAVEAPTINAKAAILVEHTTGETLFEMNADERLYPASITKMMTGILALELGDPTSTVVVSTAATKGLAERGSSVYLVAGEEINFLTLVEYLLIASGNDAANALAEHIAGSEAAFVDLMNSKARELGMNDTHFVNPNGLHDENHYTTARDIVILSQYAMKNSEFARIVAGTEIVLPVTNKHAQTTRKYATNYMLSIQSTNKYRYEGTIGIKTGSTTPAGLCLASAINVDDLSYYTVILGAATDADGNMGSFTETIKLFDYAKKNFSMQVMLKTSDPICEVPVRLAADRDAVKLQPAEGIVALLPADFSYEDLELRYKVEDGVDAPVEKGQVLGTLEVIYKVNGKKYGTVELLASEDIERSEVLYVIDRVTTFISSTTFKIIVAAVVALILIFVVYVIIVNRRRRKRKQRYGGKYRQ